MKDRMTVLNESTTRARGTWRAMLYLLLALGFGHYTIDLLQKSQTLTTETLTPHDLLGKSRSVQVEKK